MILGTRINSLIDVIARRKACSFSCNRFLSSISRFTLLFNKLNKLYKKKSDLYIREMNRFMKFTNSGGEYGLPYTSHNVDEKEILFTFSDWWPIVRSKKGSHSISLASSLWRFFAVTNINPFNIDLRSNSKKEFSAR